MGECASMLEYKGYVGQVEFDSDTGRFHGEVVNIRDVITFQATTVDGLPKAFRESIDDYLEFCAARTEEPEKPLWGQFVLRIPSELRRQICSAASRSGKSLHALVSEALSVAASRTRVCRAKKIRRKAESKRKSVRAASHFLSSRLDPVRP